MAWGGLKQLFFSAPPVALGRRLWHNAEVAATAVGQARAGDWDLAANTLLELPQENAEAAARVLTGAIDAALSIPAAVRVATDPQADPEKRGAAAVAAVQNIAAVVATVAGAASPAKGVGGSQKGGPKPGQAGGEGAGRPFSEKTKAQARAASNNTCVFCGQETTAKAGPAKSEIDHAIPRSRGGNNSVDNAQNTCRTCNRQKSAQTTDEFIERK
jgi:hypothetical protein